MTVQSALGSFTYEDSSAPFRNDRDKLWRTHIRHCHSEYGKQGRQAWQVKQCCLYLAASDYLLGLQTSYGVAFPITLDATLKFANRSTVSGGECFSMGNGNQGKVVFSDAIVGTPICVGLFNQQRFLLGQSSGALGAQAFSQASAMSFLSTRR